MYFGTGVTITISITLYGKNGKLALEHKFTGDGMRSCARCLFFPSSFLFPFIFREKKSQSQNQIHHLLYEALFFGYISSSVWNRRFYLMKFFELCICGYKNQIMVKNLSLIPYQIQLLWIFDIYYSTVHTEKK